MRVSMLVSDVESLPWWHNLAAASYTITLSSFPTPCPPSPPLPRLRRLDQNRFSYFLDYLSVYSQAHKLLFWFEIEQFKLLAGDDSVRHPPVHTVSYIVSGAVFWWFSFLGPCNCHSLHGNVKCRLGVHKTCWPGRGCFREIPAYY